MYYVNLTTIANRPVYTVDTVERNHVGASLTMDAACALAREHASAAADICNQGSRAVSVDGVLYAYAPGVREPVDASQLTISDMAVQVMRERSVSMVAHAYTIDADRYMTDDDALTIITREHAKSGTNLPIDQWLIHIGANRWLAADVAKRAAARNA